MPEYLCQIGDPGGELARLRVAAPNADEARARLAERGHRVLSVVRLGRFERLFRRTRDGAAARPAEAAGGAPGFRFRRRRVKPREVLLFNQELAALLRAGLPLAESLAIMVERMDHPTLRAAVSAMLAEVRAGAPLSEAAARHRFFPGVYSACLRAGESSGDLAGMIERFTAAMRVAVKARSNLAAALVYPAFLLAALLGTAGFLLLGVVPSFIPFFAGFDQQLPPLTRALLGAAEFLRDRLAWVAGAVAAAAVAAYFFSRTDGAARLRDRFALSLPAVGEVLRLYSVSQFCRALGTLLAGGMPLAGALPVAAGAVSNRHFRAAMAPTADEIRQGRSLADTLDGSGEVPGFALQMVRVGESTGDLARMVLSVSDFNDEVVENRVAVLLSLLTPVVLVILGGFVALVLLAIYLPLFSLASVPQF